MNRDAILRNLYEAEHHVQFGERLIGRQRDIVRRLFQDRYDTREAETILLTLSDSQTLNIADRDRLRAELKVEA